MPHWGSFSAFLLLSLMLSKLSFSTLQHLVKACGKKLADVCELGVLLGLIGILISDVIFKGSLKVELVYLYSDL